MNGQTGSVARLIESFARLPGIGRKTASRLAYHVMRMDYDQAMEFASAIVDARNNLHYCACCQNISDEELCPICADESRDSFAGSIMCCTASFRPSTAWGRRSCASRSCSSAWGPEG